MNVIPYTDALLTPSDTPKAVLFCLICLLKQTNSLPISARLKQPSLMQGGQKRRRRGPEARQSTVMFLHINLFVFTLTKKNLIY